MSYFIGIDGGGTKCRALLQDHAGNILSEALAGSANPTQGMTEAQHSVVTAATAAIQQSGIAGLELGHLHAGIGLAGVNLPTVNTAMQNWQHPFKAMRLAGDLHIACLGAHGGADGAIIITGTGSSAAVVCNGQSQLYGGHGFLLGDKGSGAWFGREAVRCCLEVMDGLAENSQLVDAVLQHLGVSQATDVVECLLSSPPASFARIAPVLFVAANNNDPIALNLVQEGAGYISRLARRLMTDGRVPLAMVGGIAEPLNPWLDDDVQSWLQPPMHSPEVGAVLLAKQGVKL